ncbi:MAG: NAD-dependent epimerase/dehydratase family protein [Pseudomonadota bacterium]
MQAWDGYEARVKVFVTGLAGFIGFHTATRLVGEGHDVSGIDNLNDYYPPALKKARLAALPESVHFVEMDLSETERLAEHIRDEKPDVVLHLAAQAGVRYSIDHPMAYAASNLVGHLSVLEACRHCDGLSHLVYASSSSVYGGNEKTPFHEDDPVDQPVSLYAATKRADELMSSTYAHLYGLKQIGLRFFTVYGPWGRPDMAYWSFSERILSGDPIRLFNHGDMMRDFTYVDDIVDGIVATVTKPPGALSRNDRPHKIYNIGHNEPVSLMEFVETLEQACGKVAKKEFLPMQPGDVYRTFADISDINRDYGFSPKVSLKDGIAAFVEWFKAYRTG